MRSETCADTAKLVRQALKKRWPRQKFYVRSHVYSGGSSIHIRWTDGPTQEAVHQEVSRFGGADFDSSQDLKTYVRDSGADWVNTDRHLSADLLRRAAAIVAARYGLTPPPEIVVTPSGHAYMADDKRRIGNDWVQYVVMREAGSIDCYTPPMGKDARKALKQGETYLRMDACTTWHCD